MRVAHRILVALAALGTGLAPPLAAQGREVLLPAESAAKAKALIQESIQALGGEKFLGVHDVHCDGRLAQFSSQGELGGYVRIFHFVLQPDKVRTEYSRKRNIINVNNGDKAWMMDRGGVEESPAEAGQRFLESLKKDIEQLFRYRLDEEGLIFRYQGGDLLDLRQVEWIEVIDRERRSTRIAFEKSTRLPMRAIYLTRDPETRERFEEVEYLSNYHAHGGVQTPMQVGRERNARKVFQVFWESCQYNTGLKEDFFTREALEATFAKLSKGKKKKKD